MGTQIKRTSALQVQKLQKRGQEAHGRFAAGEQNQTFPNHESCCTDESCEHAKSGLYSSERSSGRSQLGDAWSMCRREIADVTEFILSYKRT